MLLVWLWVYLKHDVFSISIDFYFLERIFNNDDLSFIKFNVIHFNLIKFMLLDLYLFNENRPYFYVYGWRIWDLLLMNVKRFLVQVQYGDCHILQLCNVSKVTLNNRIESAFYYA